MQMRVSYVAVVAAVVAAFLISAIWYSPFLFGEQLTRLRAVSAAGAADTSMPAWKVLAELVRELVVACVLARLVVLAGIVDWKGALSLGFWLWLGFPVVMLVGASLWEDSPWMLVLIHGGDWLVKMLVMTVIVGVWRR
jgi:hypothetical protein